MLVAGAGGLLLQLLDDLLDFTGNKLVCWADVPVDREIVLNKCTILRSDNEVIAHFASAGNQFLVAAGDPEARSYLTKKFIGLGGVPVSFISPHANVSAYATIGSGVVVLHGSIVEAGCVIGDGVLINSNATITHEVVIGDFSEIGPGVTISGRCKIGSESFIGAGATILPRKIIGSKVIVGAQALITVDVDDNTTVAGVPAKPIG